MLRPVVPATAEECDVAIIGGGGDGLIAAALLARKRLRVLVFERNPRPGGRLVTREFHPGFRASPFQDEVAPVAPELHWSLDLARRGVLFLPTRITTAAWPDRLHIMEGDRCAAMLSAGTRRAAEVLRWAGRPSSRNRLGRWYGRAHPRLLAEAWSCQSLADVMGDTDSDGIAHTMAAVTAGRAADPFLRGSALHVLTPGIGTSGTAPGGMGRLGRALADAAIEAGAEIVCGNAVGKIHSSRGRARGVVLADGAAIRARAIISTLDIRHTLLALCKGEALPPAISARAQAFRTGGGTARILLALSCPPRLANAPREVLRGSIFVAPHPNAMRQAHAAWHAQLIPDVPPIAVRIVSATDPSLAPLGAATMTVTVGCIPHRPLDGEWCFWKRDQLRANVLMHLERVFPGMAHTLMGWEVLTPWDIEEQLGATNGDLAGGEIAADQMFGLRPGFEETAPRSFLPGLYLAGKSTPAGPLATGAAGAIAARAVLSDLGRG